MSAKPLDVLAILGITDRSVLDESNDNGLISRLIVGSKREKSKLESKNEENEKIVLDTEVLTDTVVRLIHAVATIQDRLNLGEQLSGNLQLTTTENRLADNDLDRGIEGDYEDNKSGNGSCQGSRPASVDETEGARENGGTRRSLSEEYEGEDEVESEYDTEDEELYDISSDEETAKTFEDLSGFEANSSHGQHAVPVNFTYNYKPQQSTKLKIHANVSMGEKLPRTVTVNNWIDTPLSQVAIKYNVSKSVIGPTLHVLRDFEKKNNKKLLERVKRSQVASENRHDDVKDNAIKVLPVTKDDAFIKPVSKRNSSNKERIQSHKLRHRLRGSRRSRDNKAGNFEDSSSESVSDPNFHSEDENKEKGVSLKRRINNGMEEGIKRVKIADEEGQEGEKKHAGEEAEKVEQQAPERQEEAEPERSARERQEQPEPEQQVSAPVPAPADVAEQERREPQEPKKPDKNENAKAISRSLFSLLHCRPEPDMLTPPFESPVHDEKEYAKVSVDKTPQNGVEDKGVSKTDDDACDASDASDTSDGVPSFAYSLTSNGLYQCKSKGCVEKPFHQYIQLYKHKTAMHPHELPS